MLVLKVMRRRLGRLLGVHFRVAMLTLRLMVLAEIMTLLTLTCVLSDFVMLAPTMWP